jgi:hypothetical protein
LAFLLHRYLSLFFLLLRRFKLFYLNPEIKKGSVPITYGSTKLKEILPDPENSAIQVVDFESPAKLAQYLHQLNGNDSEYESIRL